MKDEWLNELRDRLDGYEMDAPDGLRERIARRTWEKRRRFILLPGIRTAVAAAAVAVALIGVYHIESDKNINLGNIAEVNHPTPSSEQIYHTPDDNTLLADAVKPASAAVKKAVEKPTVSAGIQEEPAVTTTSTEEKNLSDTAMEQEPARQETADSRPTTEKEQENNVTKRNNTPVISNPYYQPDRRDRNREDSRRGVSLGVFTSGSGAASQSRTSSNGLIASAIGPDNSGWHDSPMLGILTYNRGRETKSDIKHRLPVRTGLTVAYQINPRMAVETGLSYTRLVSDIHEGSDSHYLSGKQTLHYVGVPVNLKYRILSIGKADIYGAAGVLAEKCVSGKLTKDYVLDNNSRQRESESLRVKRMQWSANASAGVQYNFSKVVALYAEPGVSYHFDNGSKVRTIYSDRRFDFDLNVGFRFTVGK